MESAHEYDLQNMGSMGSNSDDDDDLAMNAENAATNVPPNVDANDSADIIDLADAKQDELEEDYKMEEDDLEDDDDDDEDDEDDDGEPQLLPDEPRPVHIGVGVWSTQLRRALMRSMFNDNNGISYAWHKFAAEHLMNYFNFDLQPLEVKFYTKERRQWLSFHAITSLLCSSL